MMSVISTKEERKTMARRLGFSYSCTASINIVSVLREPAEPPKSSMSAFESSAAFCATVAGIQRVSATSNGITTASSGWLRFGHPRRPVDPIQAHLVCRKSGKRGGLFFAQGVERLQLPEDVSFGLIRAEPCQFPVTVKHLMGIELQSGRSFCFQDRFIFFEHM